MQSPKTTQSALSTARLEIARVKPKVKPIDVRDDDVDDAQRLLD
jgi:hypothetical protein